MHYVFFKWNRHSCPFFVTVKLSVFKAGIQIILVIDRPPTPRCRFGGGHENTHSIYDTTYLDLIFILPGAPSRMRSVFVTIIPIGFVEMTKLSIYLS